MVPRLAPGLVPPHHLAPIVDAIEASYHEQVRVVISAPPQHGKSQLLKTALVKRLLRGDARNSAYCTYNIDRAEEVSLEARYMADEAGISWEGNLRKWGIPKGPSVIWTGIGGGLTGHKVNDLLVIDDPIKDRVEASSKTYRDRAWNWLMSVAFTRLHPGTSVLMVATRWHEDDISGRLIRQGWPAINMPAINDAGEALWPEQRPLSFLEEHRANDAYTFAALFQGCPRPAGDALFNEPAYYDELPEDGRYAHGVDLAYTEKTYADHSVLVTMMRHGSEFYVVDVQRRQCDAPTFAGVIKASIEKYGGRATWHAGGTEKGVAQFVQQLVPKLDYVPATVDKYQRAQPVSAAWNEKRVLLPRRAPWLESFLSEVLSFSGVKDSHDDQVDALASAFSQLSKTPSRLGIGTKRILPF
jgi:predicted phage terminase large subunit-like protein